MTPDEILAAIELDPEVLSAALAKVALQDATRGSWPSPRAADVPAPPWPAEDDPALTMLQRKAVEAIKLGMPIELAMADLAAHAWFEGGVENYDRGQADARRLRSV